ncbi:hypothetical protein JMUB7517_27810 [Staphylococcus aureus]
MTEEELDFEREAQIARGEMPRYGGQHASLPEEQRLQLEAEAVSYTHLRAHETTLHLVCRLLLEKKKRPM